MKRIFRLNFVADVELCKPSPRFNEFVKIGSKRHARQFPFQIGSVFLTVLGVVEHRIDIVEDVPFGDELI